MEILAMVIVMTAVGVMIVVTVVMLKALKVMVRLLMMVLTAVISALSLAIEVMVVSLLCCRCRLDIDQAARKNAQDFFKINDPDYYEFEGSNVQCLHLKDRCSNV